MSWPLTPHNQKSNHPSCFFSFTVDNRRQLEEQHEQSIFYHNVELMRFQAYNDIDFNDFNAFIWKFW